MCLAAKAPLAPSRRRGWPAPVSGACHKPGLVPASPAMGQIGQPRAARAWKAASSRWELGTEAAEQRVSAPESDVTHAQEPNMKVLRARYHIHTHTRVLGKVIVFTQLVSRAGNSPPASARTERDSLRHGAKAHISSSPDPVVNRRGAATGPADTPQLPSDMPGTHHLQQPAASPAR